jgi:hypothetical protein
MLNFDKAFFCISWDYQVILFLIKLWTPENLLIYEYWNILEWSQLDYGVCSF